MLQRLRLRMIILGIAVIFAFGFSISLAVKERVSRNAIEDTLRLIGAAMCKSSHESSGERYPLRSAEPGVFLPDMNELAKWVPDKTVAAHVEIALHGKTRRPLCYTGYTLADDALGLTFVDLYKREGAQVLAGKPAALDSSIGSKVPVETKFLPLFQGVERFFTTDISNPAAEEALRARLPIMWEMPKGRFDNVAVLFLDGHVEWRHYPGAFPMSPLFINELRVLINLPQDPSYDGKAPILPLLKRILAVSNTSFIWSTFNNVDYYETHPSVTIQGRQGYRVGISGSTMVLFDESPGPAVFPAASVLAAVPPACKPDLSWWGRPARPVDIGSTMGFHCYGRIPYHMLEALHTELDLSGGEDFYPLAAEYYGHLGWSPPVPDGMKPDECRKMCMEPKSLDDYFKGYLSFRKVEERPVAKELLDVVTIIQAMHSEFPKLYRPFPLPQDVLDEANRRYTVAADNEAKAVLCVMYAIHRGFGKGRFVIIRPEGVEMLRGLPHDVVMPIVQHLAKNVQDREERAKCQELFEKLQAKP